MEKRTIGAFIAVLRKANGMTQRELAERLHVSDKTVSRWERDEGTPELALIPVIAELFGVSCDELLRGQRSAPEVREATPAPEKSETEAGSKAAQRLLDVSLQRFRIQSMVACGVSCVGLVAALAANFAFLRGYLGAFIGLACFTAAILCEVIFIDRAFTAVAGVSNDHHAALAYRWRAFRMSCMAVGGITGALIPSLAMLLSGGAHYGLTGETMAVMVLLFGAVWLVLFYIGGCAVRSELLRRDVLRLPEKALENLRTNLRLQRRIALCVAALLALLALLHGLAVNLLNPWEIAGEQRFDSYDDFRAFAETPVTGPFDTAADALGRQYAANGDPDWQAYYQSRIVLRDGTVVCEYLRLNGNAASISWVERDGSPLPIIVVTYDALAAAQRWVTLRNILFICAYGTVIAGGVILYFRQRRV